MRLLKKIVRKLYHLIWFLSIFIFFLPIVKADVNYNVAFQISGRSPSSVYNFTEGGYNFTGHRDTNIFDRYAIDFTNSIDGYQFISFYIYNTNNWISTDDNVSLAAPPLVSLNRYPCDVTSVGATQSANSTRVGYMYLVLCPVYSKSTNNLEMNWVANTDGYYLHDAAVSTTFNGFSNTGDLSELEGINQQMRDSLIQQNNKLNSIDQSINSLNETQEQTNEKLDDIDDTLNDDNVDGANSQVDDLLDNSNFDDSTGIQSIINAPLNFINSLSNTCSPINVTIPYIDEPLQIPCIKQELNNHIPLIVPILSTAINGFIVYRILLDLVRIIKNSRNPDDDRIEVLDL